MRHPMTTAQRIKEYERILADDSVVKDEKTRNKIKFAIERQRRRLTWFNKATGRDKVSFQVPELFRLAEAGEWSSTAADGNNGVFVVPGKSCNLNCIASDTGGWEHVSVSTIDRCPTWEEMQAMKELFWGADERVIQIHPPASEYVNCHPYCLHLWRWAKGWENWQGEWPKKEMVG